MPVVDLSPSPARAGSLSATPTGELVKHVLTETRELITLEVRLAQAELREDLERTQRALFACGIAYGVGLLGGSGFVVALIFALGGTVMAAVLVGAALVLAGAAGVTFAYTRFPASFVGRTRAHVKEDATVLKEHVA